MVLWRWMATASRLVPADYALRWLLCRVSSTVQVTAARVPTTRTGSGSICGDRVSRRAGGACAAGRVSPGQHLSLIILIRLMWPSTTPERITPHVLRHFCAAQLYLGGMDAAHQRSQATGVRGGADQPYQRRAADRAASLPVRRAPGRPPSAKAACPLCAGRRDIGAAGSRSCRGPSSPTHHDLPTGGPETDQNSRQRRTA